VLLTALQIGCLGNFWPRLSRLTTGCKCLLLSLCVRFLRCNGLEFCCFGPRSVLKAWSCQFVFHLSSGTQTYSLEWSLLFYSLIPLARRGQAM
jgi:hypothetical protein